MKKQEAIELVNKGIGSIYSKEDVINLINQIEESKAETPSFDGEAIVNAVADFLDDGDFVGDLSHDVCDDDLIDFEECEFSMDSNNTVELNSVYWVSDEVDSKIESQYNDLVRGINKAIVDACTPKEEEDTSIDEQVEQGEQGQNEQ